MSARRLIVNADELGRTRGVNQGVAEAHRDGIVTSATLMVTGGAAGEVPALAAQWPRLSIGLHLQFTAGVPRLPAARLGSLLGPQGRLPDDLHGVADADPAEVLAEARAQLEAFRALMGGDPSHLDGHHHCHRVSSVFAAVVALAREIGRPVRAVDAGMAALLRREGIATADHLEENFFDDTASAETLVEILRLLPAGTTELVCHPAVVDEALRSGSRYAEPRGRELVALTSARVREAVRETGIELVGFAEL